MPQDQKINHPARRLTLICCVVLVAGALTYWLDRREKAKTADSQAAKADHGLVCTAADFDFGRIPVAKAGKLDHQFVITNTSLKPIRIVKTETTCGCTKAEAPTEPIPPGATASVMVEASWPGRQGQQGVEAILHTDRSADNALVLNVKGYILMPAILFPSVLNFGEMEPGEKRTQTVELTDGTENIPFTVSKISLPSQFISIKRKDDGSILNRGPGIFNVSIEAPPEGAMIDGNIFFETTLPNDPIRVLTVTAECQPIISVVPESLFMSAYNGEVQREKLRITVRAKETTPTFEVLEQTKEEYCPFRVVVIDRVKETRYPSYDAIVAFAPNERRKHDLCRANLRITAGGSTTDVALVGWPKDKQ